MVQCWSHDLRVTSSNPSGNQNFFLLIFSKNPVFFEGLSHKHLLCLQFFVSFIMYTQAKKYCNDLPFITGRSLGVAQKEMVKKFFVRFLKEMILISQMAYVLYKKKFLGGFENLIFYIIR